MKKRRPKAKKYYLILDGKKHNYGAFPRTKEGKARAEKHIVVLKKKTHQTEFQVI